MCDDPRIESRIASILTGSGLPMDRRTEIAEELRCHLRLSIASKRESRLPDEDAVEAALAEFGSPEVIRKRLCRQQGMLDRRQAIAEVRRNLWQPVMYAGLLGILPAVLAPETESLPVRFLGAAAVFISVFVPAAGFMYGAAVFGYQVQRLRPRNEYRFSRSCLRWTVLVALGFVGLAIFLLPTLAACAPVLARKHHIDISACSFVYNVGVAWMDSAGRNFGLCGLGVLVFGLTVAFYERTRCVDEPDVPAAA